jgi:mRNA degradation ribonuclease J1/J2
MHGNLGNLLKQHPVLDYLKSEEQGIKHLVISCSHPHEDHTGGLKDLVRDLADLVRKDAIPTLETVDFVDAINASDDKKRISSLSKIYEQRWNDPALVPRTLV